MATDAPVKVIRLKVRCDNEAQFKRELANRVAARIFVPTETPLSKDTLFSLHLRFSDGEVRVKGIARVMRTVEQPKRGMHCKFVSLDPDSIQFSLDFAPYDPESGPSSSDAFQPSTTGEQPIHPEDAAHPDEPHLHTEPAPAAPTAREWMGGLKPMAVLGNYQLLDRLGTGGMAEVYAARATMGSGVEKIVALKVVLPEFGPGTQYGGLFLNEAKISASLQHPSLIQVFDFGEAKGRPYLAMEYVRGRDLATVLQVMRARGMKPSLAFAAHVVLEVVKALDYLHERTDVDGRWMHLVHRDVSPGNVLLSENGEVKLVDFGVAAAGPQTAQQPVAGKFSYMPPEQLDGQDPAPGWDLYAAGVMLYEMLTLEPLFEGDTAAARTGKREPIGAPSEKNPQVSKTLDEVVQTATNAEVQRRYGRARKMIAALELELQTLAPADVGLTVQQLFDADLENEKRRLDQAVMKARQTVIVPPKRDGESRRVGTVAALVAVGVALIAVVGAVAVGALSRARELDAAIARFDDRMASGSLSGPGGDTALDVLAAARAMKPDDPRVKDRTEQLAKVFELLAEKALARGDDVEAAVHLQALLLADPARAGVKQRLEAAEARVREKARKAP